MGNTACSTEARARALVQQFQQALDQQLEAAEMRAWPYAPKHIREAHGDPSQPEPPSREAMDAWSAGLEQRMLTWSWRCVDNLEKGERAVRVDASRADVYWNRATKAAERALAELQDSADRQSLGAAPGVAGVASPIPVLGGVTASRTAAADQASYRASQAPYDASVAWTIAAYVASGLITLVVLGVGGFLLGEPFAALVLAQVVLLVVGFLPALGVVDRVARALARRAVEVGKAPGSAETAAFAMPPVLPIAIAVVSWIVVTSQ